MKHDKIVRTLQVQSFTLTDRPSETSVHLHKTLFIVIRQLLATWPITAQKDLNNNKNAWKEVTSKDKY